MLVFVSHKEFTNSGERPYLPFRQIQQPVEPSGSASTPTAWYVAIIGTLWAMDYRLGVCREWQSECPVGQAAECPIKKESNEIIRI